MLDWNDDCLIGIMSFDHALVSDLSTLVCNVSSGDIFSDFSIDKTMNSLGPKLGYALPKSTLPNPVDIVLVFCQKVTPDEISLSV
jgi:hypothetical protein